MENFTFDLVCTSATNTIACDDCMCDNSAAVYVHGLPTDLFDGTGSALVCFDCAEKACGFDVFDAINEGRVDAETTHPFGCGDAEVR